ncbi:3-hydroxyacyl-CoA dehydrogenase [Desulfofundulus thermocisternus]|uniref:3-hydroxyacyl-CoA dehydrogenase n=1 Tax=Desulfofundulus thermocisternus TaxID=42471 RepID=UPI00217CCF22|nr:3-hydroxyacyl-CoA dehydrogenase [Desulfofundulus thermocisternus]MCS5694725.1 3-hydroxyacyl-CoA dehydrogenase [Desulfofundulus thermocisternus]
MRIEGCIVVVTGGASGLGEATVRQFVARGSKAVILDLAEEAGNRLAAELGNEAIFIKTNVVDAENVQNALNTAVEKYGGIHVLVNCAGISMAQKVLGSKGPHSLEDFNKIIQVNLVGTFNVIRLAVEKMAANIPNQDGEKGVIINTASVAAFEGQIGQVAYSASKAGIAGMILPLARELAEHGIRVMGIAPGIFDTPMLGQLPEKVRDSLGKMIPFPPRLGKPSEFASLAMHIVENPMLNGFTIRLDGAIRMQPK